MANHLQALQEASYELRGKTLVSDRPELEDTVAAVIGLYGLRVLAASKQFSEQSGLGDNLVESWNQLKREVKDVGSALNQTFDALGQGLKTSAFGHHPDYQQFREEKLTQTILTFDQFDVAIDLNVDLPTISQVTQQFLTAELYAERSITTPNVLNTLMARLLVSGTEKKINSVYDPTCGIGGSLVAVHKQLHALGYDEDVQFFGQDVDGVAVFIAAWNLLLHGIANVNLKVDDTLQKPRFTDVTGLKRFDLVIAQPPLHYISEEDFGPEDKYRRFRYGTVISSRADYAFMQHIVGSLAPRGKAAVVMALTALSRSGFEEGIRARIVHAGIIDAVISFQNGVPIGRNTPAAILIFNLAKPLGTSEGVFLMHAPIEKIDPQAPDEQLISATEPVTQNHLKFSQVLGVSRWTTTKELEARQYSLIPQAYISKPRLNPSSLPQLDVRLYTLEEQVTEANEEFKSALSRLSNRL